MKETWESGDSYEYFMGRWSNSVARAFLDWLSPPPGLQWLDIGCGSGALSEAVINYRKPAGLTAIDQSEGFIEAARRRLGSSANCRTGNALALPLEESSADFTVSGLVLNFISEQQKALAEMIRVTAQGGTVAVYVWDYAGRMDLLRIFWDTVVELDPQASHLHEGIRFPDSTAKSLKDLFENAGLKEAEAAPIEIDTYFPDFDDYWKPFLGGQGPAPAYVLSLDETERSKLRDVLYERLPIQTDGSIPLAARAWAAKGKV
jgi:ubiquinone/menaquinone biosynthesis C-methylase UbiE